MNRGHPTVLTVGRGAGLRASGTAEATDKGTIGRSVPVPWWWRRPAGELQRLGMEVQGVRGRIPSNTAGEDASCDPLHKRALVWVSAVSEAQLLHGV